ncbi:unnamed protein product [Prorocentrum cordatum]|uniref:Uncharacterized protein n=1 Tax=Prorocentrum cordatum TaxID=2364126 RepID=A0ABN9WF40_9DINO|nr:unnamed protein product [Polarella glacialis]
MHRLIRELVLTPTTELQIHMGMIVLHTRDFHHGVPSIHVADNDDDFTAEDMCCACDGGLTQCKSHEECDGDGGGMFCSAQTGRCEECSICFYCGHGVDNTCGCCGDHYPLFEGTCNGTLSCLSTHLCVDDQGAVDLYGYVCDDYGKWIACGEGDDTDFTASLMCCACRGGVADSASEGAELLGSPFWLTTFSSVSDNNFIGQAGFSFTNYFGVLQITALGRPLPLTASTRVTLWDSRTEQALAFAEVGPHSITHNGYALEVLSPPVTIWPGEYRISQWCFIGMDPWPFDTTTETVNAATALTEMLSFHGGVVSDYETSGYPYLTTGDGYMAGMLQMYLSEAPSNVQTFRFTGGEQYYETLGYTQFLMYIYGAGGGNQAQSGAAGGSGGYAQATVTVPPGIQRLSVVVGEAGLDGGSACPSYAYGGGGTGGCDGNSGGGAGGGRQGPG